MVMRMNNEKTFKYVDKDRLIPWLKMRLEQLDSNKKFTPEFIAGYKDALSRIQELIDAGLFDTEDWNTDPEYVKGYKVALIRFFELVDDGLFDWQPAE